MCLTILYTKKKKQKQIEICPTKNGLKKGLDKVCIVVAFLVGFVDFVELVFYKNKVIPELVSGSSTPVVCC